MGIRMEEVRYIESVNVNKLQEAIVSVGKGPCVKFNCPRQALCAEEEVECKAFRFWVNNNAYTTMRKGKKTSIVIDIQRLLKDIE